MDMWIDLALALPALTVALWLRPWRGVDASGPPWPWLAWWALLPALWGVDRYVNTAVVQPMSGACLLVLMAGWPLAVLGLLPVALFTAWAAHLPWDQALHRGVWLGLMPATLTLLLGCLRAALAAAPSVRLHPGPRLLRHRGGAEHHVGDGTRAARRGGVTQ